MTSIDSTIRLASSARPGNLAHDGEPQTWARRAGGFDLSYFAHRWLHMLANASMWHRVAAEGLQ